MQKFKQRIKYYLIGLLIGLIVTYFMFGNRGCEWLPENRVKNMIAEKEIQVGDSVKAVMECLEVDQNDVYRFLDDDGDVDFSKSRTKEFPKVYHIEGKKEGEKLVIYYALYEEYAEVIEVQRGDRQPCPIGLSNLNRTVVPLPDTDVIQILESNEFRIKDEAKCAMECYGLTEDQVLNFHKTAHFNAEKSDPRAKPNGIYAMDGDVNGILYTIVYEAGESRTRVAEIRGVEPCLCP